MELDIRRIAEQLIGKLMLESDAARTKAEGARLLFMELVKYAEAAQKQEAETTNVESN